MTLTPKQRRRAVEVMARAVSDHVDSDDRFWKEYRRACISVLTALLTVADVTWKENGDG